MEVYATGNSDLQCQTELTDQVAECGYIHDYMYTIFGCYLTQFLLIVDTIFVDS